MAYEQWLKQIIPAVARFPGYQGVHILRSPAGGQLFEIAVRFSSEALAHNWLSSPQCMDSVAQSKDLFYQQEMLEICNDIDFWFSLPSAASQTGI